eukprot:SAG11_NODE_5370_length_1580_cov_17.934504_1_plen_60_part_10
MRSEELRLEGRVQGMRAEPRRAQVARRAADGRARTADWGPPGGPPLPSEDPRPPECYAGR